MPYALCLQTNWHKFWFLATWMRISSLENRWKHLLSNSSVHCTALLWLKSLNARRGDCPCATCPLKNLDLIRSPKMFFVNYAQMKLQILWMFDHGYAQRQIRLVLSWCCPFPTEHMKCATILCLVCLSYMITQCLRFVRRGFSVQN